MLQLSLCQLGGSVATAIQLKRTVFVTNLYVTRMFFIDSGVGAILSCKPMSERVTFLAFVCRYGRSVGLPAMR